MILDYMNDQEFVKLSHPLKFLVNKYLEIAIMCMIKYIKRPDPLTNFTKPLINYSITSPANKEPQRYNHNYTYLGKDNIFRKEPYN